MNRKRFGFECRMHCRLEMMSSNLEVPRWMETLRHLDYNICNGYSMTFMCRWLVNHESNKLLFRARRILSHPIAFATFDSKKNSPAGSLKKTCVFFSNSYDTAMTYDGFVVLVWLFDLMSSVEFGRVQDLSEKSEESHEAVGPRGSI